jgi:hypothetical protein
MEAMVTPLWQLPKHERNSVKLEARRARDAVSNLQDDVATLEHQLARKRDDLAAAKRHWAGMIDKYGSAVVVDLESPDAPVAIG